jgi:hypothetical protein
MVSRPTECLVRLKLGEIEIGNADEIHDEKVL